MEEAKVRLYAETFLNAQTQLEAAFNQAGKERDKSPPDWAYSESLVGAHYLTQNYIEGLPASHFQSQDAS